MTRPLNLISLYLIGIAVFLVACGQPADKCSGVTCAENFECDPSSGSCVPSGTGEESPVGMEPAAELPAGLEEESPAGLEEASPARLEEASAAGPGCPRAVQARRRLLYPGRC